MKPQQRRPAGITFISFFFVSGALASGLAALMLLLPGSPLDVLWHINPRAHQGFLAVGLWAILLMCTVCLACAGAALGLWHCREWGYWTAIGILGVNLVGDTINAFMLQDWRTAIGLPIGGLMIAYLYRNRRLFFCEKAAPLLD
jgi:hypothetical protein